MKLGGTRLVIGSRHISTVKLPVPLPRASPNPVPARPIQRPSTSSLTPLPASTAYATLKTASASALCLYPR